MKAIPFLAGLSASLHMLACSSASPPNVETLGQPEKPSSVLLEKGASALQRDTPVAMLGIYLVGFHPMKDDPSHQMEAHHFCHQLNEDFMQCALFDGNTKTANLNGIEFIISEKLFNNLPEGEKRYWHPHNYEILSGQLLAPGLPSVLEKQLMKQKINSYGKTWHVWDTGNSIGRQGQSLPLGGPMLAWSFNHDGEINLPLLENRDRRLGVDTTKKRKERQDLQALAKPQEGKDALRAYFDSITPSLERPKNHDSSDSEAE